MLLVSDVPEMQMTVLLQLFFMQYDSRSLMCLYTDVQWLAAYWALAAVIRKYI